MGKYKISIEYIEDTKDKPILDFAPVIKTEITIDDEVRADEVIEHFLKLMEVMGWCMGYYLEELGNYLDKVDKKIDNIFNLFSPKKGEE